MGIPHHASYRHLGRHCQLQIRKRIIEFVNKVLPGSWYQYPLCQMLVIVKIGEGGGGSPFQIRKSGQYLGLIRSEEGRVGSEVHVDASYPGLVGGPVPIELGGNRDDRVTESGCRCRCRCRLRHWCCSYSHRLGWRCGSSGGSENVWKGSSGSSTGSNRCNLR